jgi:diguanylate cyclase (GGDEF)-like protein
MSQHLPPPPREGERHGGRRGRFRRGGGSTATATDGIDPVTGVPDRRALGELLASAVARSRAGSTLAVLAFVELDQLREVNDSFGPDAGDRVLRLVAERLGTIDLPGTRVLRYEGAVFALVFEQVPNVKAADEVGRFLVELLADPFTLPTGEHLTLPVFTGLSVSTDQYKDLTDMVHDARQALVRARELGHGAHVVHDESKRARFTTRIDERRLALALDNREFVLHYQPISRLDTGDVIGAEALLRWEAPGATNVGVLYPHDFLPLLEKSGLIVDVGRWVLDEACRQAADWAQRFPDRLRLFVTCNLGARQLADPRLPAMVAEAVGAHPVEPWQLCLDITDEALRYNGDAAWTSLRGVKELGVKLGLDDFGVGVSSLAYLRELRLDVLRIDRVFVTDLEHSAEDRIIVRHVAALAHDLHCLAVAKGVETPEQADILRDLDVDLAQGFHFGRPTTAEGITGLLEGASPDGRAQRSGATTGPDLPAGGG